LAPVLQASIFLSGETKSAGKKAGPKKKAAPKASAKKKTKSAAAVTASSES
jgi:hypothetical protein